MSVELVCDRTRRDLTAYLDGELDADTGTLVRVHLRGCEACRQVAADEGALRDGLRALPSLDPPASLWAGVRAQLAAEEEVEAARPRWRRTLARWAPSLPRFATGGLVAAAAVTALWWRANRAPDQSATETAETSAMPKAAVVQPPVRLAEQKPAPSSRCRGASADAAPDVSADLALDAAQRSACYAEAADGLLALAATERGAWTDEQRAAFDRQVIALRQAIDTAGEGRPRDRAWRAMVRYLQHALVRDEIVALASGGIR